MRLDRRLARFHGARTALVDRQDPLSLECCLQSLSPPRFVFCLSDDVSVGVFFPRSPRTTVPLTPLSPLPLLIAVPTLRLDVSDEEGAAEATVTSNS